MVFLCSCGGLIWENRVHVCGTRRCSCGGIQFEGRAHYCGYNPDYSKPPTEYERWRGLRTSDEWIGSPNWGKRSPSLFNTKNQEKIILNSAASMEEIKNLQQTGSFQEYCKSFDILLTRVILSEESATSLFMGGLRSEIGVWVKFLRPKTLEEAYEMAKNQINLFAILDEYKEYKKVGGEYFNASYDKEFTEIEIQDVVESGNGVDVLEIRNEIQKTIEYESGKEIEELVIDGESRTDENVVNGFENKIGSLNFVKVEYAPEVFVKMPEEISEVEFVFSDKVKSEVNVEMGLDLKVNVNIEEMDQDTPNNVITINNGKELAIQQGTDNGRVIVVNFPDVNMIAKLGVCYQEMIAKEPLLILGFFYDVINKGLLKTKVRLYMWHKWKIKIGGYLIIFGSNKYFDPWKWKKGLVWTYTVGVCNLKCIDCEIMEFKIVVKLVDKKRVWEIGLTVGRRGQLYQNMFETLNGLKPLAQCVLVLAFEQAAKMLDTRQYTHLYDLMKSANKLSRDEKVTGWKSEWVRSLGVYHDLRVCGVNSFMKGYGKVIRNVSSSDCFPVNDLYLLKNHKLRGLLRCQSCLTNINDMQKVIGWAVKSLRSWKVGMLNLIRSGIIYDGSNGILMQTRMVLVDAYCCFLDTLCFFCSLTCSRLLDTTRLSTGLKKFCWHMYQLWCYWNNINMGSDCMVDTEFLTGTWQPVGSKKKKLSLSSLIVSKRKMVDKDK